MPLPALVGGALLLPVPLVPVAPPVPTVPPVLVPIGASHLSNGLLRLLSPKTTPRSASWHATPALAAAATALLPASRNKGR